MIVRDRNPDGGVHEIPRNSHLSDASHRDAEPKRGSSKPHIKFLTVDELLQQPPIEPLIEDVLVKDSLATLSSTFGKGKTFLAIDMVCSIATGEKWFGRKVAEGLVLYVAAEGSRGFRQRILARAGSRLHDRNNPMRRRLRVLPHAVNFMIPAEFEALLEEVRSMSERPVLIVLDTLARSMVGGEENSARDMGIFVDGCERLREATGATVLVIHHFGKNGEGERGSSALGGAADTMLEIAEENGALKLSCKKQKDGLEFEPVYFRLVPTTVEVRADGRAVTSCVVAPIDKPETPKLERGPENQEEDASSKIVRALRECGSEGMTGPQIKAATGIVKGTFYDHLKDLIERNVVEIVPGSNPKRYRLRGTGSKSESESGERPDSDTDSGFVPQSESESAAAPKGAADPDS
jgi:hypothetical protein